MYYVRVSFQSPVIRGSMKCPRAASLVISSDLPLDSVPLPIVPWLVVLGLLVPQSISALVSPVSPSYLAEAERRNGGDEWGCRVLCGRAGYEPCLTQAAQAITCEWCMLGYPRLLQTQPVANCRHLQPPAPGNYIHMFIYVRCSPRSSSSRS